MSTASMSAAVETIAPGIHRVETPLGERYSNLYVIAGDDAALLLDTGVDGIIPSHLLPALAELGIPAEAVRTVVISHPDVDHYGGITDVREHLPNAEVIAGAADRPLIEDYDRFLAERGRGFVRYGWDEDPGVLEWLRSVTREGPVDRDAVDREAIDLGGLQAIVWHVPGHSHGHLAVEVPSADALVVSDAVLGASVDLADGTPAFPPTYRYVDEYLATVAALEERDPALLLTAHYPVMDRAASRAFLAESRAFAERLESLILDAIAAAPDGLTLAELLARLNPVAGAWPAEGTEGALAFPVVGHLERLRDADPPRIELVDPPRIELVDPPRIELVEISPADNSSPANAPVWRLR